MKQTLSDWSSIAEIAAAFGVILTLMFVGMQIKEGNQETRASTVQSALQAEMLFQAEILRYAETWTKVATAVPITDPVESRRAIVLYNMLMTVHENRFHQHRAGYLETIPLSIDGAVSLPFFEVWRTSLGAGTRSAEYLEFVDGLRSEVVTQQSIGEQE